MHPLREAPEDQPGWLDPAERPPPPMDHTPGHKPSQYSEAMGRLILARLERGETVAAIAASPEMPAYATIYNWRRRHPDFADAWAEIRTDFARSRRRALIEPVEYWPVWEAARARAEGRKPRRRSGRRSTYTPERGLLYCELLAAGFTSREASAVEGMPPVAMVHRWLRDHAEFRDDYLVALKNREWLLHDEMLDLVRAAPPDAWRATKARLKQINARIVARRAKVWTPETI